MVWLISVGLRISGAHERFQSLPHNRVVVDVYNRVHFSDEALHGVQRRIISVDFFFVFLRLLFFALLLLYVT